MANEKRTEQDRRPGENAIEERLLDDGETGRENVLGAAADEFVADQQDPDHPSRKERAHGVEDPTHSKGSEAKDLRP